jgi:iron complex outermembrane receptor protein
LALFTTVEGIGLAVAQEATGGASGTSQTANPPATTTPAPPAGQTAAPGTSGAALPEVQVIQEQPKLKPKPIAQAPKPEKSPTPVAPPPPTVEETANVTAGPTEVKMSPIGGSEIPIPKVPGAVGTVSASEIARTNSGYVGDALAAYVPGIVLSDVQGNVFQTNVDYRGFSSGPVDGVPQGLAVYQNGVRINESFGDTVNYASCRAPPSTASRS